MICFVYDGVKVVSNTENIVGDNEYMESCIHVIYEDVDNDMKWVDYEKHCLWEKGFWM